jgi:hypothetical protein
MIANYLLGQLDPLWIPITASEFLIFLVFTRTLPFREGFPSQGEPPSTVVGGTRLRGVALSLLAFALFYLVHLLHAGFLPDFAMNVVLLASYLWTSRGTTPQHATLCSMTFVLATEVGKIVCVDLVLQPLGSYVAPLGQVGVTLLWAALSQGIALLCLLVMSRWLFLPTMCQLTWGQVMVILLPVMPYVVLRANDMFYSMEYPSVYWSLVGVTLALGVIALMTIAANAGSTASHLRQRDALKMEALLSEQHHQYLAQKRATDALRAQYHDLKHLADGIRVVLDDAEGADGSASEPSEARKRTEGLEELRSYLGRLDGALSVMDSRIETGNEVLDVLLTEKRTRCSERGIRTEFYVDARCLSFVGALDLCAIFGNLLDNAMEAVERMAKSDPQRDGGAPEPDGDRARSISLDVRRVRDMVVIRCANPFTGPLKHSTADGGRLVTTKPDPSMHGYGLRSIQEAVERNGGSITYSSERGVFALTAFLPLPEEMRTGD